MRPPDGLQTFKGIARKNDAFFVIAMNHETCLSHDNEQQKLSRLFDKLSCAIQEILGGNLVGIYLHGSIAQKAFRWNVSDVDFLIVVQSEPSVEAKRKLLDTTLGLSEFAPPKGLEWSVVTLADCLHVSHPVPFCLHYSIAHKQRYLTSPEEYIQNMKGRDADLAAYFAIVRQCGIVLYGKPIEDVFGPVPKDFVMDSFRQNIVDDDTPNGILNHCRYEAYRQEGIMLSKIDGALWALKHLPTELHTRILSAMKNYE